MTATGRSARTMTGKSIVDSQFQRAANLINLDDYMRRILMRPFREVQVEVPVRMDDGRIEVFKEFVGDARGDFCADGGDLGRGFA